MGGNFLNLFVALLCGAAFMYQVDLFCDYLMVPKEVRPWGGVPAFVVGGGASFAFMLVNFYLFMRS